MSADLVGSAGRVPSVSVVIPNYNGRQLLEANLPLVKEMLRVSRVVDGEIVVSDDALSDD